MKTGHTMRRWQISRATRFGLLCAGRISSKVSLWSREGHKLTAREGPGGVSFRRRGRAARPRVA
jgi:hypothetical protein